MVSQVVDQEAGYCCNESFLSSSYVSVKYLEHMGTGIFMKKTPGSSKLTLVNRVYC